MTDKIIKTRFAPSPTGSLHLGGARTALFNWLFARASSGKFVLRIEDTDRERSTEESVNEILESLEWLGLDYDEGPHFQSRRTEIYNTEVQKLLDEKKAYRCYCTREELDAKRQAMQKAGKKPMYDRTCRGLDAEDGSRPHVIRFKTPIEGVTSFKDSLRGTVEVRNEELDDLIIRRTDGNVTYNLVVVIDDAEMGITHVIRGDDHLANTPRQVNLYRGLGYEPPSFTHVSLILGKDKKRLSKRHGASSVTAYRDMGYLPEAMINMLARLGWGHGDKEIFTRDELIELFTLEKITMSHAVFDVEKLDWLNAQHMKLLENAELAERVLPFLHRKYPDAEKEELEKIVPLVRERSRTLIQLAEGADFYFAKEIEYEEKAAAKFLTEKHLAGLEKVVTLVRDMPKLDTEELDRGFREIAKELSVKMKEVAQPVRVALTGKTVSPGVFEMIGALGKEETLKRLETAVEKIKRG